MCPACAAFPPRNIPRFQDYEHFAAALKQAVEAGILRVSEGAADWPAATFQVTPRPDTVDLTLDCLRCPQRYLLWVDFYHGGARWMFWKPTVITPWKPAT